MLPTHSKCVVSKLVDAYHAARCRLWDNLLCLTGARVVAVVLVHHVPEWSSLMLGS